MAAAKALTIVDRWEVGGGERERKREGSQRKEDDAQKKKNEFRNGYLI